MSDDALFQLGMGSVQLYASQTEDLFAARVPMPCAKDSGGFHSRRPQLRAFFCTIVLPRHALERVQVSTLKA